MYMYFCHNGPIIFNENGRYFMLMSSIMSIPQGLNHQLGIGTQGESLWLTTQIAAWFINSIQTHIF